MSRIATLGIKGELDLSGPRAEWERFRQEIQQNPLRLTTAPTGGAERTVTTFDGRSVTTTAPPNVAPLPAPVINGFNRPSAADTTQLSHEQWLANTFGFSPAEVSRIRTGGTNGPSPVQTTGPAGTDESESRSPFSSRFGRLVAAGTFAAYAVNQALEPFVQQQRQSVAYGFGVGDDERLSALRTETEGVYSSAARYYARKGIAAAIGTRFGNYQDPDEEYQSVLGAQRAREREKSTAASISEARGIESEGRAYGYQAISVANPDPFVGRLSAIRGKQLERDDRISNEYNDRKDAIALETDVGKRQEMQSAMDRWIVATNKSTASFDKLTEAQIAAARREQVTTAVGVALGARAAEYQRAGFYGGAKIASTRAALAKYGPVFDDTGSLTKFNNIDESQPEGKVLADQLRGAYKTEVAVIGDEDSNRSASVQSSLRSSRLARGGRPLDAEIEAIHERAREARQGKSSAQVIDEIFDREKEEEATARAHFRNEGQALRTTQSAEQRALLSGLAREPGEAGAAFGIGAAGLNEARDLIRSQRPDEARESLVNTTLKLDLVRQTYFDAFRGTQVDPRLTATQGGRQSEDPNAVIQAIEKAKQDLIQGFKDAMAAVVDSGS